MQKKQELIIFAIIMVFIFFSNRLPIEITLTISGILLVGLVVYRLFNKKK